MSVEGQQVPKLPSKLDLQGLSDWNDELFIGIVVYLCSQGFPYEVACEAAQTAITKAVMKLKKGVWESVYIGALFIKAKRLAIDMMRKRERETGDASLATRDGGLLAHSGAGTASSEMAAKLFDVNRAVKSLPDDEEEVICLYHFCGLTLSEVGRCVGTDFNGANRIKMRAEAKLRITLAAYKGVTQ